MKPALPNSKLKIEYWKLTEWGILAIVAIMPFHAFLSIYLGHIVDHQSLWQGWKEVIIAFLVLLTALTLWKRPETRTQLYRPLTMVILAFIAVSLLITAVSTFQPGATLLGIKTDLEFLVLFVVAQIRATKPLLDRAVSWFLTSSLIVSTIALIQPFLSLHALTQLGYSTATINPQQYVEGTEYLRVFSTLGGPNQLGSFLILPLCIVLWRMVRNFCWWHPAALGLILAALGLTFSRSAWLGAVAALSVTLVASLPRRQRFRGAIAAVTTIGLLGGIAYASVRHTTTFTSLIRHGSSTAARTSDKDHAAAIDTAVRDAEQYPLGLGLGSAGPASFQSDHPLITENYYLQIAIETGIIGLILFVGIMVLLALSLLASPVPAGAPLLGGLVGISIVNLFLHGWADSTTALTYWAMAGLAVGLIKINHPHEQS